jgi:LCP family protein required for cell wall assembly
MAIPPVPGKKLSQPQKAANKRAPAHSARRSPARKVPVADPDPSPPSRPIDQAPRRRQHAQDHPHRALHRLLIGANIFLALCVLTAAAGYGYLKFRIGQLEHVKLSCAILRNCGDDDPGKPMNVLLVGSDTRANISKAEQAKFGTTADVGSEHTDTMMVLHVDPTAEKAAILSIPRDLWVPIAGTNFNQRINTAYAYASKTKTTVGRSTESTTAFGIGGTTIPAAKINDGPERLIATIRQSLGIDIDHFIQVDFNGFRSIVNAVGGVTVPFPAPARDRLSGLDVKTAGCVSITGDQALAYVRSRHFQYFEAGRWHDDPRGDIGRIERQQDFIRRMMRKAISKGVRNPIKLNALIGAGINNVKLDSALSTKDILRIGKQFKSLEPEAVDMLTLPADNFRVGKAAVLKLRKAEAQVIIDRFNGIGTPNTTPGSVPPIPPGSVRVVVLNGTGVNGQAGQAQHQLSTIGFGTGGVGDAPNGFSRATTEIRYGAGQLQKAQLLQAYVVGGARLVPDATLRGGDIQLILGAGFGGIRPTLPKPGDTSTVPSTTSTTRGVTPTPKGASVLAC